MTLIEKFKLDHPDNNGFSDEDVSDCMVGCPRAYGYTSEVLAECFCGTGNYNRAKYEFACTACWNREYQGQKKAEPELTINFKEEKKMKNLRNLIVSKVEDVIASGRIDECVEEVVDCMKLDSEVNDLIETEIENTIEDYVGPILSETVRDAVREALDNLFN